MSKKYTYVDPYTREVFRIAASNGIEAKIKFEWVNERISDEEILEKWGIDPDEAGWEFEDVEDVTAIVAEYN
jgi:hypothetical protein